MYKEEIVKDSEVVDEDKKNGKSPRGIEPANYPSVQDLIELSINGLEASSRDLSTGHWGTSKEYFIPSPERKSTFQIITALLGSFISGRTSLDIGTLDLQSDY
jgi:hypothetical protein